MTNNANANLRVAIVHDYLTQKGGAERVVLDLLDVFPGAGLFTSFYEPASTYPEFKDRVVHVSRLNAVRFLRRDPRKAFPLLPFIFNRKSFGQEYDLVICSSSGWSHGVVVNSRKVVYCHSPARWLWAPDDYFREYRPYVRVVLTRIAELTRRWDVRRAGTADLYLSNSTIVRDRIYSAYGIDAPVVHPAANLRVGPGLIEEIDIPFEDGDFFLTVGRARGYKNTASVVDAFSCLPSENLVVVGEGWEEHAQQSKNIASFFGLEDDALRSLYSRSKGLITVSNEDFGLTPIEAFSAGTPVIALRAGGFLDTCGDPDMAMYIDKPDKESVLGAVRDFGARSWDRNLIRNKAKRFTFDEFKGRLIAEISEGSLDSRF